MILDLALAFLADDASAAIARPRQRRPLRRRFCHRLCRAGGVLRSQVSLGQLKGRPLLVTFWATWCAPCRDELPLIRDEYVAHRNQGFAVVAIDLGDESPDTVKKFWTSMKLRPAPVLDPEGKAADAYGVSLSTGLPVSVLVAKDGRVSSYEPYPLTADYLDPALAKIIP